MKFPLAVLTFTLFAISLFLGWYYFPKLSFQKTPGLEEAKPKPLEKYTYENLSKADFKPSEIAFGEVLKDESDFISQIFYFYVDGKKISGLVNIPKKAGAHPIILMLRGFVEKEKYTTGIGTQRAGEYFAQNGFITLAPDFLGYGESDNPSDSAIEERFQTYTTAITLIKSISSLSNQLSTINNQQSADISRLGIWAHSNGGQIAMSILEITGAKYPTVLWAPVSKPFPYSILYYTDEFADRGKALRRVVSEFEKDYDVEAYSPTNFLDRINAPIQLHQGTADDAVPLNWSDNLNKCLKDLKKEVEYFKYPGADHNLTPGWNIAVSRNLEFFRKSLES